MGRSRYRILDERYPYFITSTIVEHYNLFDIQLFRNILIGGMNFMTEKRNIEINAYVIMPNHFHMIAKGKYLGLKIARFKSFTARKILDALEGQNMESWLKKFKDAKCDYKKDREHQLWMEGFHPKQMFNNEVMRQKVAYIHHNPVKSGLVNQEKNWKYSSWGDYFGSSSGLVDVTLFRG